MTEKAKILKTELVTHDVRRFVVEKPKGYKFTPGQATDVSINKPGWEEKTHPFTFTALNDDKVLEFVIKGYPVEKYPNHKGVTELLHKLKTGDEILVGDPWGTISYKGPGVFIAGGAGITPFIAILRDLNKKNKLAGNTLIFSNKTKKDVILEKEFKDMFSSSKDLILTLTREKSSGYKNGRVNKEFLQKYISDFSQHFYICGPRKMVEDLKEMLSDLGASVGSIVFEE